MVRLKKVHGYVSLLREIIKLKNEILALYSCFVITCISNFSLNAHSLATSSIFNILSLQHTATSKLWPPVETDKAKPNQN